MRISQFVISSDLKFSKNVYAFTQEGVAMLSVETVGSEATYEKRSRCRDLNFESCIEGDVAQKYQCFTGERIPSGIAYEIPIFEISESFMIPRNPFTRPINL